MAIEELQREWECPLSAPLTSVEAVAIASGAPDLVPSFFLQPIELLEHLG